jgi:hypothetical protein
MNSTFWKPPFIEIENKKKKKKKTCDEVGRLMLQELWQVLQTFGEDSTRTKKAMNSNLVAMARLTGFVNSKLKFPPKRILEES